MRRRLERREGGERRRRRRRGNDVGQQKLRDDSSRGDALGLGGKNGVQASRDDRVVVRITAGRQRGGEIDGFELFSLGEVAAFAQETNAAANVCHVSPVRLQGWKLERQLNWQRRGDPTLQTMFNKF